MKIFIHTANQNRDKFECPRGECILVQNVCTDPWLKVSVLVNILVEADKSVILHSVTSPSQSRIEKPQRNEEIITAKAI